MPEASTPLQRQLAGAGRPTALAAFRHARRAFQAGKRLDMQALAAELGVNRATLYRWVGSREQLLAEIIWSLTERAVATSEQRARQQAPPDGSTLAALLTDFVEGVLAHPGMRRFLEDEGELALRLLTLSSGGYQPRLVALVDELSRAETAAGRLRSPLPAADLAYTVVRVMESFVYLKTITGEDPDSERAGRVIHALLPPAHPAKSGLASRA